MAELTGYERAPFVGRAEALRFAEDRLRQAAGGQGKMLLLAGEPGIGKSRLRMSSVCGRSDLVGQVTGRCYEFEATQPYGPVSEAIRQLVKRIDTSQLGVIAGRVGPEIGMIVPELRPLLGSALPDAAGVDRFRLFESVIGLTLALAQDCTAGLLVVLDDLHWADEATLRLVAQFVRRARRGLNLDSHVAELKPRSADGLIQCGSTDVRNHEEILDDYSQQILGADGTRRNSRLDQRGSGVRRERRYLGKLTRRRFRTALHDWRIVQVRSVRRVGCCAAFRGSIRESAVAGLAALRTRRRCQVVTGGLITC